MTESHLSVSGISGAQPAAELRAVTKRFGNATALDRFSLTAHAGEFLTLLGPSGCGKTTALRLISGLEQPDDGAVLLAGQDVTALPPHRREVNQVFQSYALFPHLDIFDNVAFGLRMKRVPKAEIHPRVSRVLALVAMDGLERRRPAQLSGGQRQRVALARALVCEPKVLLLDEPMSALDARLRAQVREELRALQRRLGLTFILVTHDQEEALAVSDRIAVINQGRVEQIGGVQDIYHRPASRFVAGFVGEANLLEADLIANIDDGLCSCRLVRSGDEFVIRHDAGGGLGRATILVRPERVCLLDGAEKPANWNVIWARVEACTFQGAARMLLLRTDSDLTLRALLAANGAGAPPIGASIAVRIAADDCVLLKG